MRAVRTNPDRTRHIGARMPVAVYVLLDELEALTGRSKTDLLLTALKEFLDRELPKARSRRRAGDDGEEAW